MVTRAVVEAFNKASVASARQQIDRARSEAAGQSWNFDVKSAVTLRPTAIAELLTGVDYADGAAHPINYVSTVVIDSRTAQPITLKDLFANEQSGLNRLFEQTKAIWPKVYGQGDGPMPDEPETGRQRKISPTGFRRRRAWRSTSMTASLGTDCR